MTKICFENLHVQCILFKQKKDSQFNHTDKPPEITPSFDLKRWLIVF